MDSTTARVNKAFARTLVHVFDSQELDDYLKANPTLFPPEERYASCLPMVAPEQLPGSAAELVRMGYGVGDVRKVLGGNFRRVARARCELSVGCSLPPSERS